MNHYPSKFKVYHSNNWQEIPQISKFTNDDKEVLRVVSSVLPFRVNNYVLEHLIDWDNIPNDPIYQLTFPQKGMLLPSHYDAVASCIKSADKAALNKCIAAIRSDLNPHPAGQLTKNIPSHNGNPVPGIQHKYKETILFFPANGQTCHSYCTFCFRWAQFIGDSSLKFMAKEVNLLREYVKAHPDVTDVLITGGDPLIAKTDKIKIYLEALLKPEFSQIRSIRIGTKALSYWPQRFVTDSDADDLLRLFERVVKSGKHLAIMAHINHSREMSTDIAIEAVKLVRMTGAVIRSQAPILAHINNSSSIWADLWKQQVRMGIIPYYMFIERDTGASCYFELPLYQALKVYKAAQNALSGLAKTARGPCMSTDRGKVLLHDVVNINHHRYFVLSFIQARNITDIGRVFFAKFDSTAVWFDALKCIDLSCEDRILMEV